MKSKLSSKTIWITRALSKEDDLQHYLSLKGLKVINYPLIELTKNEEQSVFQAIDSINEYDWLIIPSPNAAGYLYDSIKKSKAVSLDNITTKISCLGIKTREKASALGLIVDHISMKANIQDLLETIPVKNGNRIIYFTSDRVNQNFITDSLKDRNCSLKRVELYKNKPNLLDSKQIESINISSPELIAVYSYSAIDALCLNANQIKPNIYNTSIVCVGPRTADYAISKQFNKVTYSSSAKDKDMLNACLDRL